jgi:6-phosphogluconolactonase
MIALMCRIVSILATLVGATLALLLSAAASAAGPTFYVPNPTNPPATVSGFALEGGSTVAPLPGSPFVVGQAAQPYGFLWLAFAPDGTGVVGSEGADVLQAVRTEPDGAMATVGNPIATPAVYDVVVTPDGRFAYAMTAAGTAPKSGIRGWSIGADGSLTALGSGPFGSGAYRGAVITPDGRFLYATNGEEIQTFAIGADGTLTPVGSIEEYAGHALRISADGRFLFFAEFDRIYSMEIGLDGSLTPAGPSLYVDDSSVDYAIAPDGKHLYISEYNPEAVVTIAIGSGGELSFDTETHQPKVGGLVVSPDDRQLFFSGHEGEVGVGTMPIGADGVPGPATSITEWTSDESAPVVLRPSTTKPVAAFTASLAQPGAPTAFDAGASTGAARYEWSFGDGSPVVTDGGAHPSHTYAAPGTYAVTLTVFDQAGCSTRFIYLGRSAVCPADPAATTTRTVTVAPPSAPPAPRASAPVLTGLRVTHHRFALKPAHGSHAEHGTAFVYRLSERAKVTFTITRHGTKKALGKLVRAEPGGAERTPFSGRLGKVALEPGRYKATAVAVDAAGRRSAPRSVAFRIVPD